MQSDYPARGRFELERVWLQDETHCNANAAGNRIWGFPHGTTWDTTDKHSSQVHINSNPFSRISLLVSPLGSARDYLSVSDSNSIRARNRARQWLNQDHLPKPDHVQGFPRSRSGGFVKLKNSRVRSVSRTQRCALLVLQLLVPITSYFRPDSKSVHY